MKETRYLEVAFTPEEIIDMRRRKVLQRAGDVRQLEITERGRQCPTITPKL